MKEQRAFKVAGLVLGIVGFIVSVLAIVFSAIGLHKGRKKKYY